MNIVFSDSNVLYWLFLKRIKKETIMHSIIFEIAKKSNVKIYVSSYVFDELKYNYELKEAVTFWKKEVHSFLEFWNIHIIHSRHLSESELNHISTLCFDEDDYQILADAIDAKADFLVTKNPRDFDIAWILEQYDIITITHFPDRLLSS